MIAGKHYQWPIVRGGKVVREALFHDITHEQGMRTFFEQVLTGDNTDNIIGLKGVGQVKAGKILEECDDMYATVKLSYLMADDPEDGLNRFVKNLDLLWIWRNLGETYTIRRELYDTSQI
jgi:hypothetical protein